MEYIGDVIYDYERGLYINMTNRCPCRCQFCVRNQTNAIGQADSLWLKREPTVDEIKEMISNWNLTSYDEIVFCGYGEPTERLDDMLDICQWVHSNTNLETRLNTNGLSDLINGKPTAKLMEGYIDSVSISLNAPDSESYQALCRPSFGEAAYEAILSFAIDAKKYIPEVAMSVVSVISMKDIEACGRIARKMGFKFKVR